MLTLGSHENILLRNQKNSCSDNLGSQTVLRVVYCAQHSAMSSCESRLKKGLRKKLKKRWASQKLLSSSRIK